MKESIKLEQLAMYLPYGLEVLGNKGKYKVFSIEARGAAILTHSSPRTNNRTWNLSHNDFKPIVYPLSHLTKPIVVEGREFIPIEELRHHSGLAGAGVLQNDLSMVWDRTKGQPSIDMCFEAWHSIIELLAKYHFWIYDQSYFYKGLLIDKSTIQ